VAQTVQAQLEALGVRYSSWALVQLVADN